MDINTLSEFVDFCNQLTPIEIGTVCHTDMSDGRVLKIEGNRVELYHFYKGYEEWWNINCIKSAETNLLKYGINKCLDMYIHKQSESHQL